MVKEIIIRNMTGKKSICLFTLLLFSLPVLYGQEGEEYSSSSGSDDLISELELVPETGYDFGRPDIRFSIGTETNFNGKDFLVGFDAGITDEKNLWSSKLKLNFRPFYKKVMLQESEHLFYQYREKRFFLALELNKYITPIIINKTALGIYIQGDGGYYFGSYRGTSESPLDYWVIAPGSGLVANFSNTLLISLGGSLFQTKSENIPDHQIRLDLNFTF